MPRTPPDSLLPASAKSCPENSGTKVPTQGKAIFAAVLVLLVLFSVTAGCFQAFSGMASYDDEGSLIRWVRDANSGQPLYDRVQTPYGPLYFVYEWLAHVPLRIPASNDSVRFVSAFFRVAAVVLVFLLSYRIAGSILISWGAGIVAFGELSFLARETAHPQELCIVLLLAIALAGCFTGNRSRLMVITGALAAGMALTKINVGIFAVAAMGVIYTFSTKPTRLWSAARLAVAGIALLLPAVLMAGMFGQPWAVRYCILETISLAAALVAVWRMTGRAPFDVQLGLRDFLTSAVGFGVAVLLIAGFAIARGSSASAMLECLVLGPRRAFGPVWFYAARVASPAILWAILCVGLAWTAAAGRWSANRIAVLKFLLAVLVFTCCILQRSTALMNYSLPLLWLVAIPNEGGAMARRAGSFSRALLMMVGVIQFLYAFPVAGEQMHFMAILPIVIAGVCLADALRQLDTRLAVIRIPAIRKIAALVAGGLLAAICCWNAVESAWLYRSRQSLQLPGAELIHLNGQDTRARQQIVRLVRANSCATLLSLPGMPTFTFWTGVKSPPAQGGGPWILTMNEAGQKDLIRQLSSDSHACVLVETVSMDLWNTDFAAYASPVARFIRENFRTEFDSVGYRFLVRR